MTFHYAVLFEVGTDIIYTLSCVHDFKQEMLTTTVKDGLLAVRHTGAHSLNSFVVVVAILPFAISSHTVFTAGSANPHRDWRRHQHGEA